MFLEAAMNLEIKLDFRYFIFNSLEYFLPFTASAFVRCHLNLPEFLTPVSKLKEKKVSMSSVFLFVEGRPHKNIQISVCSVNPLSFYSVGIG